MFLAIWLAKGLGSHENVWLVLNYLLLLFFQKRRSWQLQKRDYKSGRIQWWTVPHCHGYTSSWAWWIPASSGKNRQKMLWVESFVCHWLVSQMGKCCELNLLPVVDLCLKWENAVSWSFVCHWLVFQVGKCCKLSLLPLFQVGNICRKWCVCVRACVCLNNFIQVGRVQRTLWC